MKTKELIQELAGFCVDKSTRDTKAVTVHMEFVGDACHIVINVEDIQNTIHAFSIGEEVTQLQTAIERVREL